MTKLRKVRTALSLRVLQQNRHGQDMIEYALLAAAIAVIIAGFLPPAIVPMVSTIFSKIVYAFGITPS